MLHEVMIVLHAGAAILCFAFGALTLSPRLSRQSRGDVFTYYFILLVAMIAFLAGAILAHVSQLNPVQRGVFAGLFGLSLYMLLRGVQAGAVLCAHRGDWLPRYIDHIGFTLIALFEGFIIVAAIDLGAPGWLTAGLAVLGVIGGNRMLHRLQIHGNRPTT